MDSWISEAFHLFSLSDAFSEIVETHRRKSLSGEADAICDYLSWSLEDISWRLSILGINTESKLRDLP